MNVTGNILRRLATRGCTATASRSAVRLGGTTGTNNNGLRFCTGGTPADIPASAFAGSAANRASFSSRASLLEILDREHAEEIETGNTAMPQDLADLRTTIGASWKITETGATTTLRSLRDDRVRVSFHCQDTLEVEAAGAVDEYGDEEEEPPAAPVRFTVTVAGKSSSLNFACFSEDGQVKIEGVSTTSASTVDYVHEHQGMLPKAEYQGPDVTELAEDLQEAWYTYLEEDCGIDADLAAFVAMNSDFREEINYVDFLKEARSIISS